MSEILTVTSLTRSIKDILESFFEQVTVIGEISNFKAHISGHWYFTLKDSDAQIACTMWKGINQLVTFAPTDGMKVVVNGKLSVYPPRGSYQIDVKSMRVAGVGELQAAFEALKNKLFAEGLFDESRKKNLPFMPEKIGIITAIDGAAFQDILAAANRLFPLTELIVYPARMQGSGASITVIEGIKELQALDNIEVIIIARGGGSIEDLWAFNDEDLARTIAASSIPIVTGIGHEIDFTIADFAADKRAATPTAAIEILLPDKEELFERIHNFQEQLYEVMTNRIENQKEEIISIVNSYGFRTPGELILRYSQTLDFSFSKINLLIDKRIKSFSHLNSIVAEKINSFDINKTLKRGFSIIKQDGKFVKRKEKFSSSESFEINFYDGIEEIKR